MLRAVLQHCVILLLWLSDHARGSSQRSVITIQDQPVAPSVPCAPSIKTLTQSRNQRTSALSYASVPFAPVVNPKSSMTRGPLTPNPPSSIQSMKEQERASTYYWLVAERKRPDPNYNQA